MVRDNIDVLVERLGRLIEIMENRQLRQNVDIDKDVDVQEPNDQNTPVYFSTGPNRLQITNTTDWRRLHFNFVAQTINIRTTEDIEIAFAKPTTTGGVITVRGDESPFTIGGDAGIDTAFLWIRQADSAQSTPGVEVVAFN